MCDRIGNYCQADNAPQVICTHCALPVSTPVLHVQFFPDHTTRDGSLQIVYPYVYIITVEVVDVRKSCSQTIKYYGKKKGSHRCVNHILYILSMILFLFNRKNC